VATRSRLGVQDALWLTMDRPNSLMVIDTVMWFREVPDWHKVRAVVDERLVERYPVFRRRPVKHGSHWYWEDDPSFDVSQFVREVSLPAPGGLAELQAFVASQRSVPLDKTRPLWTMFLIDDVVFPDGTRGAAVMARFHHAIADGVRLVQVALGMCDLGDVGTPTKVGQQLRRSTTPVSIAASAARNVGRGMADVVATTAESAAGAFAGTVDTVQAAAFGEMDVALDRVASTTGGVVSKARALLRNPERVTDVADVISGEDNRVVNDVASVGKLALAAQSVRTVWSGTPGIEKGASFAPPIDLDHVKAIGKATATSVNDVLMATVSGTLTRYLREHGDPDIDEVTWMVPVSVKPLAADSSGDLGNYFAIVVLRMPVGVDDVRARLAQVHRRMQRIKRSDEALLTYTIQRGIAQAPTSLATGLTNFFANKGVGVLTNVPGPRQPVSLAGTVVDGVLGFAPCSGDQPMTICMFSYNGKVAVGFGTDVRLVPDGDRLGEHFAEEFEQMYREIVAPVP
jgi:diacylglycerol O-acyltransferase / wax synthase